MVERKKVLIYSDSFFIVSQTFIYHQVKSLAIDYDVHLIARKFENPHNYDISEFKQHKLYSPEKIYDRIAGKLYRKVYDSRLDADAKSYTWLRSILKKGSCKAIHAHFGPKALEIFGLAKAFNVPLVVSFHGYDASRMLNNQDYVEKLDKLFEYASAIIISSMHMADNLKIDSSNSKLHYIPYGVNPEFFASSPESENKSDKIRILHSGRIVGKKGVPDLIKVFKDIAKKFDNVELHIVGDGDELQMCKDLVDEFSLKEKVIFYGAVSHKEVKSMLQDADIFVLNSRKDKEGDMEGTPVTILEAMSLGNAVVSTRHAGIPTVIQHNKNGLLADEYSNEQFRENIERLIIDPELRKSLGKEAAKTIKKNYTTEVMKQKIQEVFDKIK